MVGYGYDPEFFANNKDRYAHYGAKYRDGIKAEMIAAYGGKCKGCGIDDPLVLNLDHINNDARLEIEEYGKNARGGHKQYSRLKQQGWPQDRFQLLCCNCNARKEHLRRRAVMLESNGERKVSTTETRSKSHGAMGVPAHNKSGIKGVFWNSTQKQWQVKIMVEYKSLHLGFFDDLGDAARAYRKKAIEVWGEHANVATDEEIEKAIAEVNRPCVSLLSISELDL